MREISFRCWDEKIKRWEYWGLPEDAGYMAGRFNKENATKKGRRFSTKTLCQFTGLHDKNGKEIYEGDIFTFTNGQRKTVAKVVFEEAMFKMKDNNGWGAMILQREDDMEVIGNIYESKHLLDNTDTKV